MSNLFAEFEPESRGQGPAFTGPVRSATLADAAALAAIHAEREGSATDDSESGLRGELGRIAGGEQRHLWVALEGERVLGYARTWYHDRAEDAVPEAGPRGWYLAGVIVDPAARRRGVALALTRARLAWIAERTDEAFYFCSNRNRVSIALHEHLGFEEQFRGVWMPSCTFTDSVGVLFRAPLR